MRIVDFHAHIYPEKIAVKASESVGGFYNIKMRYDGTLDVLRREGNASGVTEYVVHSVATRPDQVKSINDFIISVVNSEPDTYIGFATLHPDMEDAERELERIKAAGLRGVKLHPDFQRFAINEKRAMALFELCEGRFPVLIHAGDHRYKFSNPRLVPEVMSAFPKLELICAHFGGWSEWDEAERCLRTENVYVDTSSSFFAISDERAKHLINVYGIDRVLFGSDYPMWNPGDEVKNILRLGLTDEENEKIFHKNADRLLKIKKSE